MTGMYLEHYGVKGMKWGVRRSPVNFGHKKRADTIRKDRYETRNKLNKKYKVNEAYANADKKYMAAYKKLGYDPPNGEDYYRHAEELAKKVSDELDKKMLEKYGKDYSKVIKSEEYFGTFVVSSGLILSALSLYGGMKLSGMAGRAVFKVGEKAVKRVIGG